MRRIPKLLPNGNLLVWDVARAKSGTVGHGWNEVEPGSDKFRKWTEWMSLRGIEPEKTDYPPRKAKRQTVGA